MKHRQSKEEETGAREMGAWLTEITLPHRRERMTLDSGHIHRWLTRAADGTGFLWAAPRVGTLIVQSSRPLDRDALDGTKQVYAAQISLHHEAGARVEVTGILAPTKAAYTEAVRQGGRGKIVAVPPEDQPAWVIRKLSPALSRIEHLTVEGLPVSRGRKLDGTRLTHTRVSVYMHATVRDPDTLTRMLATGVGRGKRFGTGLLLAKELT